jgi:hypothetical protein
MCHVVEVEKKLQAPTSKLQKNLKLQI